jgi:hypothetical protein
MIDKTPSGCRPFRANAFFPTDTDRQRLFPKEILSDDLIGYFILSERDQFVVQEQRGGHNRWRGSLQRLKRLSQAFTSCWMRWIHWHSWPTCEKVRSSKAKTSKLLNKRWLKGGTLSRQIRCVPWYADK